VSARREIILSVKRTNNERDKAMTKILDFGKNKGKILAECDEKYLKWLASHEKVLAKRNRWAARDSKFLLERMAQVATVAEFEARKEAEMAVRIAEQLVRANVGTRAAHSPSKVFCLMR
jgi:hypothetical protein